VSRLISRASAFAVALQKVSQDARSSPDSIRVRLTNGVILVCFVYILLRPVSNNAVLIPILFLMGLASAISCVVEARGFAPGFDSIWICQIYFALIGTVVGIVAGAPGVIYGVLIYALAPVLYWTWVCAFDLATVRLAIHWLFVATAVLSTVIIIFVAGETRFFPQLVPSWLIEASGAAFAPTANTPGQIRFYGLSTLAAAGPLCAASLLLRADSLMPHAALRIYAAAASVLAALVSGRRAIVLVIILAPLIAWICSVVIRRRWSFPGNADGVRVVIAAARAWPHLAALVVGAALLLLGLVAAVYHSTIVVSFASAHALILGGNAGPPDIRVAEARALLDGWAKSPWVGNGFGATLPGFSRDASRPWNFELQYHVLLFQTGLVGVLLAAAALVAVLRQLRRAAQAAIAYEATLVATTTGAVAFLLANSVDPYLQAPGHMWAIYLPLAVANSLLVSTVAVEQTRVAATGGGKRQNESSADA
jgi:hypothetical protein